MRDNPLKIRRANLNDLAEMQQLMVETIHSICAKDYRPEQLRVWASGISNQERWLERLTHQFFLVAEQEGRIVGFASLANGDFVDLMYVHKDYQRQGIAHRLLAELEQHSRRKGKLVLTADVSETAQLFFERNGYQVIKEQTKVIDSVEISNFRMEKVPE